MANQGKMFVRLSCKRPLTGESPTRSNDQQYTVCRTPCRVIKHFISWPVLNLFGGARSVRFAAISCVLTLYGVTAYYTGYDHRQFPFSIPIFASMFLHPSCRSLCSSHPQNGTTHPHASFNLTASVRKFAQLCIACKP